MNRPILHARALSKHYRDGDRLCRALRGVDLTVSRGEFLAIMGPSGCGKTTLLNILGLMCPPTNARTLQLDGVDCLSLSDGGRTALRRQKIGFVFQRFNLLSTVSAAGNVKLALRLRGASTDGQVAEALDQVGLKELAHRKPAHLSVGEQQRAAVARAIACRPALLLADEPTGNLDSANTRNILELFRQFHQHYGLTIVMITHSLECAAAAERVMQMKDGQFLHG